MSDIRDPLYQQALLWKAYLIIDDIIQAGFASGDRILDAEDRHKALALTRGYSFPNMEIEGAVMFAMAQMADAGLSMAVTPENLDRYFKDLKSGRI